MKTKKKIKKILKHFDFAQVHDVMTHLNWTWNSTGNKVPDLDQLKEFAKKLLFEVADRNEFYYLSSGGFKATRYEDGSLELEFILTDWMVEEE